MSIEVVRSHRGKRGNLRWVLNSHAEERNFVDSDRKA